MLRLRRSVRVFGLLWAALQFALPGAVSVFDGIATLRDGIGAVAHIEDTSGKSCQPPHSAECGLCRYLSAGGVADGDVGALGWPAPVRATRPERELGAQSSRILAPTRARAPPLV